MRKIYLIIMLCLVQKAVAQNVFPDSGKVGIGTSTPAYLLDVRSPTLRLFNNGTTNLRIEGSGSTSYAGSYLFLSSGVTKVGDAFNKVRIDINRGTDSTANFQLSRMNGEVYNGIFYRYDDLSGHRFLTYPSRTATSSNASEVMRIIPNGNVGIGTAGPTAKLEVIDATGAVFRHSQTANTAGTFRIFSGAYSGNKMNGIVFGTDSTYNNIAIGGGTSLGEPASNLYFYTKKRTGLVNSGTIRMSIDSAGNVGIPSATVGYSLRVNKPLVPTGGTGIGIVSDGQIQNNSITGARYFQTSPTIASGVTSITTGAISHFYANQGTYSTTPGEQNGFYAAATLIGATNNIGFRGAIGAGTGRWNLYMDGTANNYFNGNVGIGIGATSPTSKLQVTGAAVTGTIATSYKDILVENTTNAGITIRSNDNSTSALRFNSPGSNTTGFGLLVADYTNTKVQIGTNLANGKLEFLTGNFINAATMLANGNFGVGTTFPYSRFQVSSTSGQNGMSAGSPAGVGLTVSNNNNAYGLNLGVHTNGTSWIQSGRVDGTATLYNLALQSTGGNVGIGTTTPASKLHVATNATAITAVETIETIGAGGRPYTLYKAENGNYGYVGYGINSSDVMSVFNYKNAALQFGTNSTPRMSIDNVGGVSIGTSNNYGSLLVRGNAALLSIEGTDHSYIQFFPQSMAAGRKAYFGFPSSNSTNLTLTNEFTNGSIILRNNSINALVVNSTGQIGINATTIPTDYKLAVGGNVIAEKVKVKKRVGGVWPDYVFSPDYKLPSLEEVEKFTKENSRLPEIPSAKEIENDGQDLGEMNRLLLKKVEELTLYLIEERKSNLEQTSQIKKLQEEINHLKKVVK